MPLSCDDVWPTTEYVSSYLVSDRRDGWDRSNGIEFVGLRPRLCAHHNVQSIQLLFEWEAKQRNRRASLLKERFTLRDLTFRCGPRGDPILYQFQEMFVGFDLILRNGEPGLVNALRSADPMCRIGPVRHRSPAGFPQYFSHTGMKAPSRTESLSPKKSASASLPSAGIQCAHSGRI
jgi:hypothetical protein